MKHLGSIMYGPGSGPHRPPPRGGHGPPAGGGCAAGASYRRWPGLHDGGPLYMADHAIKGRGAGESWVMMHICTYRERE